jgi:hypothetical protein
MDPAAELTLQIASFLQSEPDTPASAARWAFVPGPGRGADTFGAAVARLAALEKPLVVGVLNHPGYLAVWRPSALGEGERRHIEQKLCNQQRALAAALAQLGLSSGAAVVRFEGWGIDVDVPLPAFRRWLGEYALTWGWRIGAPTDESHQARLLVLQSGRRWSPGSVCQRPGAA